MTQKQIVKRLILIAKMDASNRDPFICSDLVLQENLFGIQEALMTLIDELDQKEALKELPFMYLTLDKRIKELKNDKKY